MPDFQYIHRNPRVDNFDFVWDFRPPQTRVPGKSMILIKNAVNIAMILIKNARI